MLTKIEALVVGAGISGLSTAFALQKAGITTLVVEAAPRAGGVIKTVEQSGYLFECGPQSFSGNARVRTLCQDLGISDERIFADPGAPRYVLIDGKLNAVPASLPSLLFSPLLGGGTRSAVIRDLFGTSRVPESEESVAQFVRRKFSDTLLDRLVGPFVSGIYAGDPDKLSLRAAFPILYDAEKASGSVLRGFFKVMKSRRTSAATSGPRERSTLQTFREGNETIIRALTAKLGERLRLATQIASLEYLAANDQVNAARFRATIRSTRGVETIEAERLILAVPTDAAAKLLMGIHPQFGSNLGSIEYAAVAVVSLAYRCEEIGHDAQGFGFLVPRSENRNILGAVWNSSLFPGRTPDAQELFTCFLGGATNPGAAGLPDAAIVSLAHRELTPILDLRNEPVASSVTIWPRAIPQYNIGHKDRIAALDKLRAQYPGLWLVGNYLEGPSIGTCVERAANVSEEVRISFAN